MKNVLKLLGIKIDVGVPYESGDFYDALAAKLKVNAFDAMFAALRWVWKPTYTYDFSGGSRPRRVESGFEYLFDGDGKQIVIRRDGTLGTGSGGAVQRRVEGAAAPSTGERP